MAGNDPEEWKRTVLATADGRLYLRPDYVFACMRDGAKYTKRGRSSLQPAVAATLQVEDDLVVTDRVLPAGDLPRDPTQPVFLDVRGVKNPGTKGRNVRYRVGVSSGWTATFHLLWDGTVVSREQMATIIRDSGVYCGLGDGRSIGMGRFEVVRFEVGQR